VSCRAVKSQPAMSNSNEGLLERALEFHLNGENDQAIELYKSILDEAPDHTDALHLLGLLWQQAGDIDAALVYVAKAVELDPEFALYRVNLGVLFVESDRVEDGIAAFMRALEIEPNLPEGHYNLGNTLLTTGDEGAALKCFQKASALRPNYAEALSNISYILRGRGEAELALTYLERAVKSDGTYAPAFSNLCAAYNEAERHKEAVRMGWRATALSANSPTAHYNLGNAYSGLDQSAVASECYRKAIELSPGYADAWCNLGVSLLSQDDPQGALVALDTAVSLESGMADAHWNRSLSLLMLEHWAEGWRGYDWRWDAIPWLDRRVFEVPQWAGQALEGRTVMVHAEQGYGDTLQFVRYLSEIIQRDGKVWLACQPALKRLLSVLPEVEGVSGYGEPTGSFDLHLPIMSLPAVIGVDTQKASNDLIPYLTAPACGLPPEVEGSGLKVGIVWRGSRINLKGMFRSCRLEEFASLISVNDCRFYSLQFDAEDPEKEILDHFGIADLSDYISDFADSAAYTHSMDLVITVDTAQAHLAGALGVPVWTLLARGADWRWFLNRDDSPWYPTMRLFRQETRNDWRHPISRIAAELPRFLASLRQRTR
jgi:tetratricopeptide (TPR) repeat protein